MSNIDEGVGTDHCRVTPLPEEAGPQKKLEFFRHQFAYDQAAINLSVSGKILEVGSGEGYGAGYLSERFPSLTAVDLSHQALHHAATQYEHISFAQSLGDALPFPSQYFDSIISFQVIEHIPNALAYVEEIARVLKPGGQFIITTPNRKTRSLLFRKPWNPYHVKEYSADELRQVLKPFFVSIYITGVLAQPELMVLERNRVKRAALNVLMSQVKNAVEKSLKIKISRSSLPLRKLQTDPRMQEWTGDVISLQSFSLTQDPNIGLDLFGIARKNYLDE